VIKKNHRFTALLFTECSFLLVSESQDFIELSVVFLRQLADKQLVPRWVRWLNIWQQQQQMHNLNYLTHDNSVSYPQWDVSSTKDKLNPECSDSNPEQIHRLYIQPDPDPGQILGCRIPQDYYYYKQDNVHTNMESVQCISIVYSMSV